DGDVGCRQDELLGVGAEVAVEAGYEPGDTGAGRQVDAGAGGQDGAGEVPAQARVVGLVDQAHLVQAAACDREVDGVDWRGGDRDPDLPGTGVNDGHCDDLDGVGAVRLSDDGGPVGECAHGSLLVGCV